MAWDEERGLKIGHSEHDRRSVRKHDLQSLLAHGRMEKEVSSCVHVFF